jgi:hypothetical protein
MVISIPIFIGTDPELFLRSRSTGQIVGSEVVIPAEGLKRSVYHGAPIIVRDGVQVEIHPDYATCRESVAQSLHSGLTVLRDYLKNTNPDLDICYDTTVEVSEEQMSVLSHESQILGCMPSRNAYDSFHVESTPGFRRRSAGGHFHIGLKNLVLFEKGAGECRPDLMSIRERMVPLLDILVGNTAVLVDRDPLAAERRKMYGRAGEYRLPDHGLEYRTLSNFWLRDYKWFSFMSGLVRMAVSVLGTDLLGGRIIHDAAMFEEVTRTGDVGIYYRAVPRKQNLEKSLLRLVNQHAIVQAINTNNYSLARENYEKIKPFIREHFVKSNRDHGWPLHEDNLEDFDYFLDNDPTSWEIGEDPIGTLHNKKEHGWEMFLNKTVRFVRNREAYLAGKRVA